MANVYCNQSLATGLDDGTSWANAYKVLSTALNGTNVGAGDVLWVKNDASIAATTTLLGIDAAYTNNPPIVFGVKSATTNEPPTQSDLIPGWRTGEARTEANAAYNDAGVPTITITGATNDLFIDGHMNIYALKFVAEDNLGVARDVTGDRIILEECYLSSGQSESGSVQCGTTGTVNCSVLLKNCKLNGNTDPSPIGQDLARQLHFEMQGGVVDINSTSGMIDTGVTQLHFTGVDFSSASHPILREAGGRARQAVYTFRNCQLHASSALVTGSIVADFRTEFYQTVNVTGKSSGTIQNLDIITSRGNITEETTAVRTGGANDGSGDYSLAFTPGVDGTRDQYLGIEGPWMYFEATLGASKTVTVYIANSGAADYNDDDVWLEVFYPSEGGTAQYDNETTQMQLLGTPAAVTDDVTSTWGSGGNNPQKLVATIDPDYQGIAYCRVVFAKNFGAAPETLYVDPLPEYA